MEHAIGSLQNPMTDANLEEKFHHLADQVIGAQKASAMIDACWKLSQLPNMNSIIEHSHV